MTESTFLESLRGRLSGLPQEEIDRSLDYYAEMIDDRMEEGMPEEDAVAAVGPVDSAAAQIIRDMSLPRLVKARVKPRRALKAWEILLMVLGSPVWLPLLLAAAAVLLAVYITLWSLILVIYAIDLSFAACAVAGLAGGAICLFGQRVPLGAASVGCGLIGFGVAVLLFFGANQAVRGTLWLSRSTVQGIKARFIRKGEAQ